MGMIITTKITQIRKITPLTVKTTLMQIRTMAATQTSSSNIKEDIPRKTMATNNKILATSRISSMATSRISSMATPNLVADISKISNMPTINIMKISKLIKTAAGVEITIGGRISTIDSK